MNQRVCSHHNIPEDVVPCSVGDQLEQPAELEELNDSGIFGQDLEAEEKEKDGAKIKKNKKVTHTAFVDDI